MGKFTAAIKRPKAKTVSVSGRGLPPTRGSAPDLHYMLALHALTIDLPFTKSKYATR